MRATFPPCLRSICVGLTAWMIGAATVSARNWTDGFSGTAVDSSLWSQEVSAANSITVNNGHVELYQATTTGTAALKFSHSLVGDFDIQVDYATQNWDMGGYDQQRMGISGSGTNGYSISVQRVSDWWFGGEVYLTYYAGASWHAGTVTTDLSGKLRLTRTGATITGYFWNATTNGGAGGWEQAYDNGSTPAYAGPFTFALAIWSGYSGTQAGNIIEFDNVVVSDSSATAWDDGYQDLGGNWRRLSWFGDYATLANNWIWHNRHGFMYPYPTSTPESVWFWTMDLGWLWTSATVYPSFYRSSNTSWIWYLVGTSNPRWFYNFTAGDWESH